MDFLRLHLPGLHQALRGALDSLNSFVSYLMGDEVPTAERKEVRAAEELGEVAAGRPGKPEEKETQEALEGLGGSQSQEDGGLGGPREAGRRQEGSSATEQTWAWEGGSSHRSQGDRQDTGVGEGAKAARCQDPRAHLEARRESKAGAEAGRDNRSQVQESQGPGEQEVNTEETLRTWEQGEEAEEVRERESEMARKVESEWTWHREPEGEVSAEGQKGPGDSRESLELVKEGIAEEIQGSAGKEARWEEEVMVVLRGSQSTRAQGAQESGTESEDGTTSGREEDGTASGREDGTPSGRGEDGTTLGREEDRTVSGREEDGSTSGRGEDGIVSGKDDRTTSGKVEDGIVSDRGEDRRASAKEEDGTASVREKDGPVSGREDDGTTSGRGEDGTTSGRGEDRTTSDRGEDRTTLGRGEDGTTSGREEDRTTSGREEDATVSSREEDGTVSGREEDGTTLGTEEDGTTSGREEDGTVSSREEDGTVSSREEDGTVSGREEDGITLDRVEARTTSVGKQGDLLGAGKTEYGEVSGERIPEGTGRAWAFEESSRRDQEEEVDENRETEMSSSPKQSPVLGTENTEEAVKEQRAGRKVPEGQGSEGKVREVFEVQADQGGKEAEGRQGSAIRDVPAHLEEEVETEKAKEEEEGCWTSEAQLPKDNVTNEPEGVANLEATPEASSPEKEFSWERGEGEAQTGREAQGWSAVEWGDLEPRVTGGQEPELVAGPQTTTEQPEEGQGAAEELWGDLVLSKEEMGGSLEEHPRNVGDIKPDTLGAEVWENQRRDVERGGTREEKADAGEGEEEEAAGGQGWEEAKGGRESALPDVLGAGREWEKAQVAGAEEGETLEAENQQLGGRHGTDAGTGHSLGESDAGETEDEEAEATVPWGADTTPNRDGKLEEATLSLKDSEVPGASSSAAEIVRDNEALDGRAAGAGEGPEREAGKTWDSEGRQEAGGGMELREATQGENQSRQGFGPEGSDKEVAGREGQAEAWEAREGEPGGEWVEVRETAVGEEIVPEGLEDVQGQEDQSTSQEPAEAEHGPHGEMGETARSAGGDACDSWSEALLPGSLLDVSVPRSRVLLSRNSSLRRSRPSFGRTRALEQQEGPPSPPPEEELSAPEQKLLQPEEPPQPSSPKPEGTPLPARRRPLGHGFGLAHVGMMQELQARLGQPKPQ